MRPACAFDGCEVGSSREGFCGAHAAPRPADPTFPVAPLVELVDARGGLSECGAQPHTTLYANYHRAKRVGWVTVLMADRFAHRLFGCHPCEIWPEWWDASSPTHATNSETMTV